MYYQNEKSKVNSIESSFQSFDYKTKYNSNYPFFVASKCKDDIMNRLSIYMQNIRNIEILLYLGETQFTLGKNTEILESFRSKYGDSNLKDLNLVQRIELFNQIVKDVEEELYNKFNNRLETVFTRTWLTTSMLRIFSFKLFN